MGNCCSGNSNDGEISIPKGNPARNNMNYLFDNREVGGLKGEDKIFLVVKIQSLIRGANARKKVRQRFGFECKTMGGVRGMTNEPNYQNAKVLQIKEKLGDF